jgi:hypothetical protein
MPPSRKRTLTPAQVLKEGTRGKHSDRGLRVGFAQQACEHRMQAENWLTSRKPCADTCQLGQACGQKFTGEQMLRAHNRMFATGSATRQRSSGTSYTCTLTFPQVIERRTRLILESVQSREAGRGFMVDGAGPVCADFCRLAHGIPEFKWNQTLADINAGRLGVVQPVQQQMPPSSMQVAAAVVAAVVPTPAAASAAASAVIAAAAAAATRAVALPLPLPPPHAAATTGSLSYAQMVDALRHAPPAILDGAVSALHASALQRGRLLLPIEQLARRGLSSINLTTLRSKCSACDQVGEWRTGPFPDNLICCNDCLNVVHQRYECSGVDETSLEDRGWQCSACDPLSH